MVLGVCKCQIIYQPSKQSRLFIGLDVAGSADVRRKYYQKAVQMHAPLGVNVKKVIDIPLLKLIIQQCYYTYMGQMFKTLYRL